MACFLCHLIFVIVPQMVSLVFPYSHFYFTSIKYMFCSVLFYHCSATHLLDSEVTRYDFSVNVRNCLTLFDSKSTFYTDKRLRVD